MTGLLIKLVVCPVTVLLAFFIFPNVDYTNLWQPIIVGLVLAIGAHLMEVFLLNEQTFRMSNVLDFFAAAIIVYFVSVMLPNAEVTIMGALLTATLLTLTEIPQHTYLIKTDKTRKSPA
ncbi:DUF2512 family protein [Alkalihalobacillus sp. AL-G]|uniref:DUF2512 family protein n=1 Tax=Alkalihalobacillus sp. AL-G TaxID=2926399 RepID=UPI00272C0E35|nr:DUF2512 family protein [Alkalihalobacillus sp. AL-G]WLD91712.1 DUF2512 family protein [Alkalihalobacillus sp. AL-G]